jgi:hypothetical protein
MYNPRGDTGVLPDAQFRSGQLYLAIPQTINWRLGIFIEKKIEWFNRPALYDQ